jgi:TatD DNase family protein
LRDETPEVYEEILAIWRARQIAVPVILHCISGSGDFVARATQQLDAYISFAGNVTYRSAQNLRDLLPLVPPHRLLIETDAPFLPPAAHRGQLCHPSYITQTAAFLQREHQIDLDQVFQNSLKAFNLTN